MSAFLSFASCTRGKSVTCSGQRWRIWHTHGEEASHGLLDHARLNARVVDQVQVNHLLDLEDLDRQARDHVRVQRRHVLRCGVSSPLSPRSCLPLARALQAWTHLAHRHARHNLLEDRLALREILVLLVRLQLGAQPARASRRQSRSPLCRSAAETYSCSFPRWKSFASLLPLIASALHTASRGRSRECVKVEGGSR